MDILLVNSNVTRCGRSGYGPTPAPVGLISLAGVLKRHGHRVKIAQIHAHALAQDEESLPLLREEILALLEDFTPGLVGISARNVGANRRPFNPFHLVEYYSVFYDARVVRAFRMLCRAPIVMGGTALSLEPGLYLNYARPDSVLVGEAEESLPSLAEKLSAGEEPRDIPGLAKSPGEAGRALETRGRVKDLCSYGIGACEAVEDFRTNYYEGGGFASIQTKRGCAMDCIYCTTPFFEGHRYRYRRTGDVIEEMKAYRQAWGARHFFIVDSTFNHPADHALEVCEAILRANLNVEWFSEVTPALLNDELCRMMARSGCVGVTLTPDSCSESVLSSYRKPFGVAEVENAIKLLKKYGIPFDTCLIIGGPGETPDTLRESVEFCEQHLRDDVVRFYDGMLITRRSRVFELAVQEGLVDPSRSYEELVLHNEFQSVKAYEYFFPHVKKGRAELLELIEKTCRGRRWLLTSKDYLPDPKTGELALHQEISVRHGARPWWRGLERKNLSARPA